MKIYQQWPGKDRFCCGLRTGPAGDTGANLYLHLSLLVPLVIYLAFCLEKLWVQASPILPLCNILLYLLTLGFVLLTSFTDPGILPNRETLLLLRGLGKIEPEIAQFLLDGDGKAGLCPSCRVFRPPRSTHCRDCDHCVLVMDHHCPFVNACVAKRNYQFFFLFLACLVLYVGSVIAGIVVFLIVLSNGFSPATRTGLLIALGVVLGLVALVLAIFLLVHCCLAFKGRTTRETLKGLETQGEEGFNWFHKDPVLVDFYAEVPARDSL
jgi:palmitoyltransferase ZDHHC9/14/18